MSTREPLVVRGAVVAAVEVILHVLVVLGVLPWSPDQEATIAAAVGVIGTAVVVLWSRGAVTPVADPRAVDGAPLAPVGARMD